MPTLSINLTLSQRMYAQLVAQAVQAQRPIRWQAAHIVYAALAQQAPEPLVAAQGHQGGMATGGPYEPRT